MTDTPKLCDKPIRRHGDLMLTCEKLAGHGGFCFHRWEPPLDDKDHKHDDALRSRRSECEETP